MRSSSGSEPNGRGRDRGSSRGRPARFRFSRAAQRDLDEIQAFLVRDDPDAARRVFEDLERACSLIARRPGLGHRRTDLTEQDLRFWSVYDYLLVYDPNTRPREFARVLHRRRDVREELD
jgi:plasmid stabilization system protein ParE